MSRPLRVEFPGAIYHAMGRGVARMKTFLDDTDRRFFLSLLERAVREKVLEVYAYVLMGNHFHLLCQTPFGTLSRWMQRLLGRYAAEFNRRHGRVGHL